MNPAMTNARNPVTHSIHGINHGLFKISSRMSFASDAAFGTRKYRDLGSRLVNLDTIDIEIGQWVTVDIINLRHIDIQVCAIVVCVKCHWCALNNLTDKEFIRRNLKRALKLINSAHSCLELKILIPSLNQPGNVRGGAQKVELHFNFRRLGIGSHKTTVSKQLDFSHPKLDDPVEEAGDSIDQNHGTKHEVEVDLNKQGLEGPSHRHPLEISNRRRWELQNWFRIRNGER
mmetsp:Transcript_30838/g.50943  ORF Transcript_30838/g.50943 Transcript_30838/m.50943 type:complete len:231 (+) Transcript_30838:1349-2041(+)